MIFCSTLKYPKFVKFLLGKGAIIDATDENGMIALFWATLLEDEEMMKILLEAKVSVSITDWLGRTALHHAIRRRSANCCRLLIEHSSKLFSREQLDGAIAWATGIGNADIVEVINAAPEEAYEGVKWFVRRQRFNPKKRKFSYW